MRRVTAVLAVSCGLMCAGLAPSSASAQLLPGLPLPLPGLGGGGGLGGLLGGLPIPLPGLENSYAQFARIHLSNKGIVD